MTLDVQALFTSEVAKLPSSSLLQKFVQMIFFYNMQVTF